jgi:hypothetical protein
VADQHHEGQTCLICQRRPGRVCDADRSWLTGKLNAIPRLYADMLADPPPTTGRDPITQRLPAGPKAGVSNAPRVSGTSEGRVPARLTVVDLSLPARGEGIYDPTGMQGRWQDQIGHVSVASVLDLWVRDWRELRDRGERLPEPTVAGLCVWLGNRLDWACDQHPAVDEFASEIRTLAATLVGVLGLIETDDYKIGIPCRGCDMLTLYQRNGSEVIECTSCAQLLSGEEYERWTGLLADRARIDRGHKTIEAAIAAIDRKRNTPETSNL